MQNYVALRPVRFGRQYLIGEIIPGGVVDPKSAKRLMNMGKIAATGSEPHPPPEPPPPEGYGTFPCPECEKVFATKRGLTAHMRSHRPKE